MANVTTKKNQHKHDNDVQDIAPPYTVVIPNVPYSCNHQNKRPLYKVCYVDILLEIKLLWKFTCGFIWPQILIFERGPKAVLFRLAKFLLEALIHNKIISCTSILDKIKVPSSIFFFKIYSDVHWSMKHSIEYYLK